MQRVSELVPPVVCLIVGLHFFPLARLFDQPQHTWTATGLCLAAGAGLVILAVGAGPEASRVVIGLVAAGTLWVTSARLALRHRVTTARRLFPGPDRVARRSRPGE